MAEVELDKLAAEAGKAIAKVRAGTALATTDLARIVSDHKTNATRVKCIKALADAIGKDMLASLEPTKTGQTKK